MSDASLQGLAATACCCTQAQACTPPLSHPWRQALRRTRRRHAALQRGRGDGRGAAQPGGRAADSLHQLPAVLHTRRQLLHRRQHQCLKVDRRQGCRRRWRWRCCRLADRQPGQLNLLPPSDGARGRRACGVSGVRLCCVQRQLLAVCGCGIRRGQVHGRGGQLRHGWHLAARVHQAGNDCGQLPQRQQQRGRRQARLQLARLPQRQVEHSGALCGRQRLGGAHVAQQGGEEQVALVLRLAGLLQHRQAGLSHGAAQPAGVAIQEAHHKLQHLFALGRVLATGGARVSRGGLAGFG